MDYKLIGQLADAGYTFAPTAAGMTRSNRTGWAEMATSDIPTIKEWLKAGDSLVSVANHEMDTLQKACNKALRQTRKENQNN
jgi:hypothetical protein